MDIGKRPPSFLYVFAVHTKTMGSSFKPVRCLYLSRKLAAARFEFCGWVLFSGPPPDAFMPL